MTSCSLLVSWLQFGWKFHIQRRKVRTVILYILVASGTYGIGLAIESTSRLLINQYNLKVEAAEACRASDAQESTHLRSYDPCEGPLQFLKSGVMIREIPLEDIKRCLKSDQARSNPSINSKTAKWWLLSSETPSHFVRF